MHLVGHSFGGLVARAAALADPAALRSLTLLELGPGRDPGTRATATSRLLAQALPSMDLETIWAAKRQLEAQTETRPADPRSRTGCAAGSSRTTRCRCCGIAEQLLDERDRTDELAALDLPVLVAFGATGRRLAARAAGQTTAERLGADSWSSRTRPLTGRRVSRGDGGGTGQLLVGTD